MLWENALDMIFFLPKQCFLVNLSTIQFNHTRQLTSHNLNQIRIKPNKLKRFSHLSFSPSQNSKSKNSGKTIKECTHHISWKHIIQIGVFGQSLSSMHITIKCQKTQFWQNLFSIKWPSWCPFWFGRSNDTMYLYMY